MHNPEIGAEKMNSLPNGLRLLPAPDKGRSTPKQGRKKKNSEKKKGPKARTHGSRGPIDGETEHVDRSYRQRELLFGRGGQAAERPRGTELKQKDAGSAKQIPTGTVRGSARERRKRRERLRPYSGNRGTTS